MYTYMCTYARMQFELYGLDNIVYMHVCVCICMCICVKFFMYLYAYAGTYDPYTTASEPCASQFSYGNSQQ